MKLLLAFFLHFIADFILQSREMGKNKSSNYKYLLAHLSIQFLVFLPFFGLKFAFLNALIHGIIDKNIWNLYKYYVGLCIKKAIDGLVQNAPDKFLKEWEEHPEWKTNFIKTKTEQAQRDFKYWEDHNFYATIGLDQFLHSATLILLSLYL